MENERLATPLLILGYASLVLSLGASIYTIATQGVLSVIITEVLIIIGLLAAFYYFFLGYKKNNAVCYKTTYIVFALSFVLSYFILAFLPTVLAFDSYFFIDLTFEFILFGMYLMLAFCKDLGKKNSLLLNFAIVLINLAFFFASLTRPEYAIYYCGVTMSSVAALIMTLAKYADKEARHTK